MFKKKNKKQLLMVALLSIMILGLTACSANGDNSGEQGMQKNKPTIVLADAQWESIAFQNSVAKTIIEEGYGYRPKSSQDRLQQHLLVWKMVILIY